MALIAKRKVAASWREAVADRVGTERDEASAASTLATFDRLVASGTPDVQAAWSVLEEAGLLWRVAIPGESAPDRDAAVDAQVGLTAAEARVT